AIAVYRFKDAWRTIQKHGMVADHSWYASAKRYGEIYRNSLEFHMSGK
ncbi:MAG: hypothetical protein JO011_10110, partial [Ktedonobacteraceae bacterium]|nr:hypothetical protein [Ktedonobacteraceae bacterium]